MSEQGLLAEQIEAMMTAPIEELGLRLMDVEYRFDGGWVLQLFIDGEKGITLDDCSAVSRLAGEVLEERDPIPHEYKLEVSSPGLFRQLKIPKHFRQSAGLPVKVRLADGWLPERRNRTVRGVIGETGEDKVVVNEGGVALELPFEAIQSAKLDPDL